MRMRYLIILLAILWGIYLPASAQNEPEEAQYPIRTIFFNYPLQSAKIYRQNNISKITLVRQVSRPEKQDSGRKTFTIISPDIRAEFEIRKDGQLASAFGKEMEGGDEQDRFQYNAKGILIGYARFLMGPGGTLAGGRQFDSLAYQWDNSRNIRSWIDDYGSTTINGQKYVFNKRIEEKYNSRGNITAEREIIYPTPQLPENYAGFQRRDTILTRYAYYPDGRIKGISGDRNIVWRYVYDEKKRMIAVEIKGAADTDFGKVEEWEWDAQNRVVKHIHWYTNGREPISWESVYTYGDGPLIESASIQYGQSWLIEVECLYEYYDK